MEKRAQEIIKQHLSIDVRSYEELKSFRATGYMEHYLGLSKNDQTMLSTADYNVMLELASIDQFRDSNTILNSLLKL